MSTRSVANGAGPTLSNGECMNGPGSLTRHNWELALVLETRTDFWKIQP